MSNSNVDNTSSNPLLQAVLELAQSKAKLEKNQVHTDAMLNALGEGLIVTDEHGLITTINRYALERLGYTEAEMLGAWLPKVIVASTPSGKPVDALDRPIVRALAEGKAISGHIYFQRKDGQTMPVFVTAAPVLIQDRPVGAIEIFRDLTREKQLDIAKEEFVSLASHQLRTPATGVKLILNMLASGDFGELTDIQKRYVGKALDSNDRQLAIIEDLLNVAQVDSGKMELDLAPTDLSALLQEAMHDHLTVIQNRHQEVEILSPDELRVMLDSSKIRMVLDNIISNASKYTLAGGKISLKLETEDRCAVISCTDTGVGIPETSINDLFTKFTRFDNELSTAVGGTGLGLYLVKNIVEMHHGNITVASKEQVGSTFTVRLPLKRKSAA